MLQARVKVIKNIAVTKSCYKIVLFSPQMAKAAKPGQFLQIRISDTGHPLLRRPFSIHNVSCGEASVPGPQGPRAPGCLSEKLGLIEIIYELKGEGTRILSQKKQGGYIDVIGPLGNGFTLPTTGYQPATKLRTTDYGLRTIIVAGGMGVAPLLFLAERLILRGTKEEGRRKRDDVRRMRDEGRGMIALIGAKNKGSILCERAFKRLGCEVKIATDDGSKGFQGRITDLLSHLLSTIDYRPSTIYSCGPRPMLKEISRIAKEYNVPAQVSLEEHMACGIGACLGCVVKVVRSSGRQATDNFDYKRVCKEGPVLSADEIIW